MKNNLKRCCLICRSSEPVHEEDKSFALTWFEKVGNFLKFLIVLRFRGFLLVVAFR